MAEGAPTKPVVLTEDPSLFQDPVDPPSFPNTVQTSAQTSSSPLIVERTTRPTSSVVAPTSAVTVGSAQQQSPLLQQQITMHQMAALPPNAPVSSSDLGTTITTLLASGKEDYVIDILRSASPHEINGVPAAVWMRFVPVLPAWVGQDGTTRQTMAYIVAFHVLDKFPEIFARPELRASVVRLLNTCREHLEMGLDLSAVGGLALQEMLVLHEKLSGLVFAPSASQQSMTHW